MGCAYVVEQVVVDGVQEARYAVLEPAGERRSPQLREAARHLGQPSQRDAELQHLLHHDLRHMTRPHTHTATNGHVKGWGGGADCRGAM